MPTAQRSAGQTPEELRVAIETFLNAAARPALFEPGEELLPIGEENYALEIRGSRLVLQAWDRSRNISRRILAAGIDNARLQLTVEKFARREGEMQIVDLARPSGAGAGRRSGRLVFRERFRLFLRRQFVQWTLADLSSEADLEHSLSPAFPRAFLRHGQHGWAAIGCPPDGDAGAALSFGLIWLDYLRRREQRVTVQGLALYVPAGSERTPALRIGCLNPSAGRWEIFAYAEDDRVAPVDPSDYGNLQTRLDPCRRLDPATADRWARVLSLPDVELVQKHDGRAGLRVRGIEFARIEDGDLWFGINERRQAQPHHIPEIEALAAELSRFRAPDASDRDHPLWRQAPEAWLESIVRGDIESLDASLLHSPVYGQTPVFVGGERGVLDLLAVDRRGRLAVIELKASADLHLPLQALDYWIHVKWHLNRGEFGAAGYFPGIPLLKEPPRLLLVSPSLEFHSTAETLLGYFAPEIEVERIGLGVEWRKGLRVMFRLTGAHRPR
jgi:hypothetical protein